MYLGSWLYSCLMRPTDRERNAMENIACYSQFPRGGDGRCAMPHTAKKGNPEGGHRQRVSAESMCRKSLLRFLREGMGEVR